MKKGFSNFNSINFNPENIQANQQATDNTSNKNNSKIVSQPKSNFNDKKDHQSNGFSGIKQQAEHLSGSNDNILKQQGFQSSTFPPNPPVLNGIVNDGMPNSSFGNYPMMSMENPQYFQNSVPTYGDNPYAMLFNQFQNGSSLTANQASSQAMIMTLFQIIQNQAKSLQSLYGKVEKMTEKINQFGQKMKQIKKVKKQTNPEDQEPKPIIQHMGQSMENIDSKTLIKILFGSNKLYNFKLQLNQHLELPLYRQRNFSISLKLTDNQGKIVKNNNKIPLSLAIYSSENPPKFIEKNTAGQKILKGYIQQSLHFGQCRFQKIQIKEVTSHFRNGWVFIVIIPCMTPLGSANPNDYFIDYLQIQPLVLEKVVVKAKKIKDINKKSKKDQEESQLAQVKDSDYAAGSDKIEQKQKVPVDAGKPKAQSNLEQSEDIFQDK